MAEQSVMIPLGTQAPDFALPDVVSGSTVTRDDAAAGRPLLVVFACRHCPYMKHCVAELARIGRDYDGRIGMVAIASNDPAAYAEDEPESLAEMAREQGFTFPVLYDESQDIARAYSAVCTPDNYLFDKAGALVYRGQLDDSRPGRGDCDGRDLRAALDAVLDDGQPPAEQKPSVGCSIKWR
ncbi:MAG TPA: thioredoxin family protein [Candidatus Dormibacteraeota bacterium]|nr:thioredoxin family protein [Candidatus Dormibacteraeota bacterium]